MQSAGRGAGGYETYIHPSRAVDRYTATKGAVRASGDAGASADPVEKG